MQDDIALVGRPDVAKQMRERWNFGAARVVALIIALDNHARQRYRVLLDQQRQVERLGRGDRHSLIGRQIRSLDQLLGMATDSAACR